MVKVIVINGAGTSGKDTFIDLFTKVCKRHGVFNVYRFSSVDEVKHFATFMGWDGVKDARGRRFLSDIKDALTRYDDIPFKNMENRVKEVLANNQDAFVFFHVREPKEIEKMVYRLNAFSLLIVRPEVDSDSFTNHADKNVNLYAYNYCVINDGTLQDLEVKADSFYNYLCRLMKLQEVT